MNCLLLVFGLTFSAVLCQDSFFERVLLKKSSSDPGDRTGAYIYRKDGDTMPHFVFVNPEEFFDMPQGSPVSSHQIHEQPSTPMSTQHFQILQHQHNPHSQRIAYQPYPNYMPPGMRYTHISGYPQTHPLPKTSPRFEVVPKTMHTTLQLPGNVKFKVDPAFSYGLTPHHTYYHPIEIKYPSIRPADISLDFAPKYKAKHKINPQVNVEEDYDTPVMYYEGSQEESKSSGETTKSSSGSSEEDEPDDDVKGEDYPIERFSANFDNSRSDKGDTHFSHEGSSDYGSEKYAKNGHKTSKGHKSDHEFSKGQKGSHDEQYHKKDYEDEGANKQKYHSDKDKKGSNLKEASGEKKGEFAEKKKHRKGSKSTGYHNVFHKDELYKDHTFYDELDHKGHHHKKEKEHKGYHKESEEKKKGAHHDSGHKEGHKATGGHYSKGEHDQNDSKYEKKHGNEVDYKNGDLYSKKGGGDQHSHKGYQKH